jgi:hypothetical protein
MAIATFGVTYSTVRAHHFPQIADFSANSNPTSTTVTQMVSASAAELGGKLRAEGLTPSSLESDASSEAYAWCAETVRLGAAIRAIKAMTGQDPAVCQAWERVLKERFDTLASLGHLALGDASAPSEQADGPRSHISNHSLDTGDTDDISDVIPVFRRSDAL